MLPEHLLSPLFWELRVAALPPPAHRQPTAPSALTRAAQRRPARFALISTSSRYLDFSLCVFSLCVFVDPQPSFKGINPDFPRQRSFFSVVCSSHRTEIPCLPVALSPIGVWFTHKRSAALPRSPASHYRTPRRHFTSFLKYLSAWCGLLSRLHHLNQMYSLIYCII